MNHELLTEALTIWQEGPKFNKEDYHSSTGLLSNSFIGDFIKCEYSAIIQHALKTESGFNENFAIGHATEAYIFEGQSGFDKMLSKYKDEAYNKKLKTKLIEGILESGVSINTKAELNKLKMPEIYEACASCNVDIYDKLNPKSWVWDSYHFAKSVTRHKKYVDLFRSEGSKYHQALVFELCGMKWRGEVDYMNLNKLAEIDLKTTADMHKRTWNEETRTKQNFIESWNYFRQRALYQYGIKQLFDKQVVPRILAICKKTKSVRMFQFDDQERLDSEIGLLIPIVDRVKEVIAGEDKPQQCERCATCVESESPAEYEIKASQF